VEPSRQGDDRSRPDRLYVSATAGSSLETGHLRGPVDALTIKTTDIAVDSENPQRIYRGFRSRPARASAGHLSSTTKKSA
jgi:hypothetical protein